MKTAGRENPNHRATLPHNRAHGAVGQNRSRSIEWAVKQEKFRPLERCFFLTLPFIELIRMWLGCSTRLGVKYTYRAVTLYRVPNKRADWRTVYIIGWSAVIFLLGVLAVSIHEP